MDKDCKDCENRTLCEVLMLVLLEDLLTEVEKTGKVRGKDVEYFHPVPCPECEGTVVTHEDIDYFVCAECDWTSENHQTSRPVEVFLTPFGVVEERIH
jgi:hypothetical protein